MFTCVIGPNLELRPHEDRFADEIYQVAIANRGHIKPFMAWIAKLAGVEDTRKFIRESVEGFANKTCFNVGIWENGRFIGAAGYHIISWHRRFAEMGYWIDGNAQGRGIMTRTCSALITHAFDGMKLHRVEIRCDPDNLRSRAIPKRLGFTQEGVLRESLERFDGVMRDAVVYGLLAHEWKR